MTGEGHYCSLRSIGMGTIRNVFVAVAVVMAITLLLWVQKEQDHVTRCSEMVSHKKMDTLSPAPIHVIVQIPAQNQTNSSKDEHSVNQKWDFNWDHKVWPNPQDANGVPTRTIILVRHGQYDFSTGILNDRGRQQANLTGSRLKELNMHYGGIVYSNMDRAKETATIIHGHLPHLVIKEDPLLAEGGPVPPEPTVNYWSLPDRTYYMDAPRLEAAFRKYFYRADKSQQEASVDILVGHANIFRFFVLQALQFPTNAWMRVFISHASISLLHINPDGTVTLTKFGDSGHFPPDMITF